MNDKYTEERTKTHACDCISRQAAIDALMSWVEEHKDNAFGGCLFHWTGIKALIENLPAEQPEQKKGKWIWKTGDVYKCSECETETHVDECFEEPIYNYCPYCNAVMDGYER